MVATIQVPGNLDAAVVSLRRGGIVCYPTETFYALGANPWDAKAVRKVFRLKRRPPEKQLPLIAASTEMIAKFCKTSDPRFIKLATLWPAPLTIVLPALDGTNSYAVRVSAHPVAYDLSRAFGGPLISTSANQSGEPPLCDPALIESYFGRKIDILIDGGITRGGLPSTIVSLVGERVEILREGAIPRLDVLAVL